MIRRFEGERLEAYQDSVGVWTIGVGHTGPDVRPGMKITSEQSLRLLEQDVKTAERIVQRSLPAAVLAELPQSSFDALVSLTFNCGGQVFGNAAKRTGLYRALTEQRWMDVDDEIRRWCYAGGRKLQGLVNRRAAEAALWLDGFAKLSPPAPPAAHVDAPAEPVALLGTKTAIGTAVSVTAGAGPQAIDELQPMLAEAGMAIEPLAQWSQWIRVLCIGLAVAGALLAIYGRLHVRRRTGA